MLTSHIFLSSPEMGNSSKLSLFDKASEDRNMFNLVDDEIIKLSGSEILLFKYYPNVTRDNIYMEEKRKVVEKESISLFGNYEPRAIEENLTQFGVEIQNDQVFIFNKSYVERQLGRPIIAGDILQPVFQNLKYEVFEVQEDSFEAYGIYHLMVHAKLLRDSVEIHDKNFLNTSERVGGLA